MAGTEQIVEQIETTLASPDEIANFCVDLLTGLGLDWEADSLWEILLGDQARIVSHRVHDLVTLVLDEIDEDEGLARETIQDLLEPAGADSAQQSDAWYVLWGQEGGVETVSERAAYVLTSGSKHATFWVMCNHNDQEPKRVAINTEPREEELDDDEIITWAEAERMLGWDKFTTEPETAL